MTMRARLGLLAAVALGAAAIHGCNATSGGLVSNLPFKVGGVARDAGGPLYFTTLQGWQVELDQAVIAVGPFYFNNQPPETQLAQSGTVIIQATTQVFVNALDPTLYPVDGGASGETGPAVSVEVDLFPPGCAGNGASDICGSSPTPLQSYEGLIAEPQLFFLENAGLASGSSAFVAGTAQQPQGARTLVVPFYGFITIDETTGGNPNDPASAPLNTLQRVSGAGVCPEGGSCVCPDGGSCYLPFTTEPVSLVARIDPTHWFDGVDFASLIPPPPTCGDGGAGDAGCDAGPGWSPDAGALTWNSAGPDGTFNTELVEQGLQAATGVYLFSLEPQGGD
jgi:hypothetical protein